VDSTVAAKLICLALGSDRERLRLLHIDNGLMRKDESRKVIQMFADLELGQNLYFVDAGEKFLTALSGVVDPEEKRAIIGNTFVEVFEREARRLGIENYLLGQGTIYPDTIETGATRRSDTIKTHHNRVPVIERMIAAGKVIEPLVELYKVEVRELGEQLGISREIVWRHPFPGPGLGVRLLCSMGETGSVNLNMLSQQASEIARKSGLSAVVLPNRSVGVKADVRCYEHPVLLSGQEEWKVLIETAGNILKSVDGINRCIWNLADEAPNSIKLLAAELTRERLDLLREADAIVMDGLKRHGIYSGIWQCPTVLAPLQLDDSGEELCILRPVLSERAMTATAAELPGKLLEELRESILAFPGISGLAVDLTSKPPGTIEWE
jgi:GMP synthase (glutamine-hydrolysing)